MHGLLELFAFVTVLETKIIASFWLIENKSIHLRNTSII